VIGVIPDFRQGSRDFKKRGLTFLPVRDDPGGWTSEAYRSIREKLRFTLDGDRDLKTLAVTSCTPNEGKTTTNLCLAMAFATRERRVLLIDADLRKPSVQDFFDLKPGFGLADILQGHAEWRDCIRSADVAGLDLLIAGKAKSSPAELLDSKRLLALIDEWTAEYDVVVFDLPPALAVADVETVARKLDALILLYRDGGVSRKLVTTAVSRLRTSGAHLVGVLQNAVHSGRSRDGGYYGYGYGYGHEHEEEAR